MQRHILNKYIGLALIGCMFFSSVNSKTHAHKKHAKKHTHKKTVTKTLVPQTPEQRIKQIISKIPGEIGVSALHIESGQRIEINAEKHFPMASTVKLPLALYCLYLSNQGQLNLQQKITFTPYDIRRKSDGILAYHSYTINNLIKLSLEISSNTATDKLLKIVGGGQKVTAWLQKNNINGLRVDRSVLRFLADFAGVKLENENKCTSKHYKKLVKQVTRKERTHARKKFYDDPRDTTTPRAMVELLSQLCAGKLVSKYSANFIRDCMLHCKWGNNRTKRFLPKNIRYWYKTGRIDGIVSDVGIIEIPRAGGPVEHLAIAVYSNRSTTHDKKGLAAETKRETAFAHIGKILFDTFNNTTKTQELR